MCEKSNILSKLELIHKEWSEKENNDKILSGLSENTGRQYTQEDYKALSDILFSEKPTGTKKVSKVLIKPEDLIHDHALKIANHFLARYSFQMNEKGIARIKEILSQYKDYKLYSDLYYLLEELTKGEKHD